MDECYLLLFLLLFQIIFRIKKNSSDFFEWSTLKVLLTTVINLMTTLDLAWNAKPSKFNETIFMKYFNFLKETKLRRRIDCLTEFDNQIVKVKPVKIPFIYWNIFYKFCMK